MITVIRSVATMQPTSLKGGRRRAAAACLLALTNELSSCIVAPGAGTARELLVPWKMRTPQTSAKATITAITLRFMPLAICLGLQELTYVDISPETLQVHGAQFTTTSSLNRPISASLTT